MSGGAAMLSAEVLLRPAGGASLDQAVITSRTLSRFQPDERSAALVSDYFRGQGFDATGLHGISITITGPASLFERTFGIGLTSVTRQGVQSVTTEAGGVELPTHRLPADVAEVVHAVTFTPPPDFGPTQV